MLAATLALATIAALRVPGPLSPRNASYVIDAKLDPVAHAVTGKEQLTWRNIAAGPAHQLVFHLYMNAFKNTDSTFFRESHGTHRRSHAQKHGWGAIDVSRLVVDGRDLTSALKVDDTLGTVALPAPLAAGATAHIEIEWKTTLPKVFARTGYAGDFYAVAQWFPKIGVFDCANQSCRWRAHQHHLNSEFFADFGTYDVTFELPRRFIVAATGVRTGERASGPDQRLTFHAEDVTDFVLAASPHFRVYDETVTDALGPLRVRLYDIAGHEGNVPRHLAAVRAGLRLMSRIGPYPYAQLSVVDVPRDAAGAGGMEYPTLFFTDDFPLPAGVHMPEYVTIHELAHQWFQGMVASDEVEEAWLDEGLTQTCTDLGLSALFGVDRAVYDLAGHHLSGIGESHLAYRRYAEVDPLETFSFHYLSGGSYGAITYRKTDLALRTVEGLIGEARFYAGLRHYFETWKFRHPRIDDFVHAFDEGAGEDLSWFWSRALRGTDVLDYAVRSVEVRKKRPRAGLYDEGGRRHEVTPTAAKPPIYVSEVVLQRRGDFVFPVEAKVVFDDGSERREHWDGRDRYKKFTYEGRHRVRFAEVDPEHKVPLDVDWLDNGLSASADSGPRDRVSGRWQLWASSLLSLVGF